ncbi:MAG: chemotaxis protein CheA [Negativicutes bacterium]|nr:chemotaxis protein CheA [Negativicutes bacterium]
MSDQPTLEPMLDMYLFETGQLIEQLEQTILSSEKSGEYSPADINEIFRVMHTIKGASGMMLFDNIAGLAHSLEDVFFYLREAKPENTDSSKLSDLILEGVDFIKNEIAKIKSGLQADGDGSSLTAAVQAYLEILKQSNPAPVKQEKAGAAAAAKQQYYISQHKGPGSDKRKLFQATVFFEEGCGMENIRAYTLIQGLRDIAEDIRHIPDNIMEDDSTAEVIVKDGFQVFFAAEGSKEEMEEFFGKTIFLQRFELVENAAPYQDKPVQRPKQIVLEDQPVNIPPKREPGPEDREKESASSHQSLISVNVTKLDRLMDLVGELVISEAMVTQNPDLRGLALNNFCKAVRQLEKITGELQDTVMSIRMLPLASTFHKMQRIVRDMCKKLGKEVKLELVGQETEVDKNIIEHISDPLMHLIRNSIDHGIESGEERVATGKPPVGHLVLEAKNAGSDVIILIKDDGRGLDKNRILTRAGENGLIHKPEDELSDKEIYSFIFAPGFSTKDKVTEFSGRGVGMDVVVKNINSVGGMVLVDSLPGAGTTITLKIPLTLAIVDGMMIAVGEARYIIPITAIKESFRPNRQNIVIDPDGNEMIMVRGQCYPILRIHQMFGVDTGVTDFTAGIAIMVENDSDVFCVFADALMGEQQVVVKPLPSYIKSIRQAPGLAGCALLGDGSIALILDIGGLVQRAEAAADQYPRSSIMSRKEKCHA